MKKKERYPRGLPTRNLRGNPAISFGGGSRRMRESVGDGGHALSAGNPLCKTFSFSEPFVEHGMAALCSAAPARTGMTPRMRKRARLVAGRCCLPKRCRHIRGGEASLHSVKSALQMASSVPKHFFLRKRTEAVPPLF